MSKLIVHTILSLALFAGAFAQTNVPAGCPSISVEGPPGILDQNAPVIFTATIGPEAKNYGPKYTWKVDHGFVVEGQGTLSIKVNITEYTGSLTGILDVEGLPKGCPSSVSETIAWGCIRPTPKLLSDLSATERLDLETAARIETQAKNEPNSQLYVVIIFAPNTSKAKQQKQIEFIRSRLMHTQQIDPDRITFVTYFHERATTRIYLVPPGASNPQP
jgi:hypothetical protein